jgi:hypothetical protein
MTVTALSVTVALIIGTVELISVLTDKLRIDSGPLMWTAKLTSITVCGLRHRRHVRSHLDFRHGNMATGAYRG